MTERSAEIKQERRRRNPDQLGGKRRRLALDESKLDREKFVYRYINDDKTRIFDLTVKDDWEIVEDREGELNQSAAMGAQVAVPAGVGSEGQSMRTVLVRKLKIYHDEDVAARQRRIDETEQGLKQKPEDADANTTYVPGQETAMKTSVET